HFAASGNVRPGAPTNVMASVGINQAAISWGPSTTSPGAAITGYIVTAKAQGSTPMISMGVAGNIVAANLTGLTGGTNYTFSVVGLNNFGIGTASADSAVVTPSGSGMTYSSTVLGDSPWAYYRLGDPSGSLAADSSGNGHHANYDGSYTPGVPGAIVGDSDTGYNNGNGTDALFKPGTGLPVGNSARTIETWIKTTTNVAGGQGLVGYGSNPSYSSRAAFQVQLVGN